MVGQLHWKVLGIFCATVCSWEWASGNTVADSEAYHLEIKGTPRIIHFNKDDYNSDSQFWVMTEDNNGILYFGNNDGVVVYDGEKWDLVRLPNGSTVRSLSYATNGNVYVGGYNEIGTIIKNEFGEYYYKSLKDFLRPEDRNFDDAWQIHELNGHIVFRSFKMLIALINNKAIAIPANPTFTYSNIVNEQLYVVDASGIKKLHLNTMEFENIVDAESYRQEEISSLLPGRNARELIAFTKQGHSFLVYPEENKAIFHKNHLLPRSSDQIFCAIKSKDGQYYLGTVNSQIISYEFQETQSPENRVFKNLQDNTVLNLFETRDGNVWALLNKGIDCIETASPMSVIFENAAVYDVVVHNNIFYLATNQGVYSADLLNNDQFLTRNDFSIFDGLEAQAWSLWLHEGKVVVAHDRGVFVIDGEELYHVPGTNGIWKVIPVKGQPNLYFACSYNGLFVLEYVNGRFVYKNRIEGFDISGRDIMQSHEPGVFWVCHGYKGVYRIKINESYTRIISLEHYTDQNGLPSPYNINIFKWQNDTVFVSNKGIYTYEAKTNRFIRHQKLTDILGKESIVRKILQKGDKTWFVQDDELGYFNTDDEEPELHKDLFLSLKGMFIKSMEFVLPFNEPKVLTGTNNGLFLFDLSLEIPELSPPALITRVQYKTENDSLIYGPLSSDKNSPLYIPYNTSSLTFDFATPKFSAQTDIQYSYKLENVDKTWSAWTSSAEKEYSYLKSGSYAFRVKSRSLLGEKSEEAVYYFEILPVWYQTRIAMFVFGILAAIVATLITMLVRRKIKKTRLEEQKLRKVLELEIQQYKLEREKEKIIKDKEQLEEDVIHKSKELANYTMLLVKKRELLTEMNKELKEIKEVVKNDKTRDRIRTLSKKINFNLQDEEHLHVFDTNFERVHQDFFNELKSNYPDLTQKELRLCGFVKMNLTNKEIASLLNISVRGVETARYRLRKRLSIEHEVNMVEFLEKLSSSSEESPIEETDEEYFNR